MAKPDQYPPLQLSLMMFDFLLSKHQIIEECRKPKSPEKTLEGQEMTTNNSLLTYDIPSGRGLIHGNPSRLE